MTSKQRVLGALRNETIDRVPLNVFAGWNPGIRAAVTKKYGSIDAFAAMFHIDAITGVLPRFPFGTPSEETASRTLDDFLKLDPVDANSQKVVEDGCDADLDLFLSVRDALNTQVRDQAVFAHAWGVFELSQFLFEKDGMPGTQDALMNMIAEREKSALIYQKLGEWSAACVENAIHAGVDVIELSDDWGQQNTMLFSPKHWRELILPATKLIVDAARKHDVPVVLHSDGDITLILEELKTVGLSGLHPVQESAGMSYAKTKSILGKDVCLIGGLDTVSALPTMNADEVRAEVQRVFQIAKPLGPFIFSGSHMFQDDTPLDVIEAAYETAYDLAAY